MIIPFPHAAIRGFDAVYRAMADTLCAINPHCAADDLLDAIANIAEFAASYHTGRFADGAIENPLLELGESLKGLCPTAPPHEWICAGRPTSCARRVLHVASQISPIGGHTRTIENWIRTDESSLHSLYLTNQEGSPLRPELLAAIDAVGGSVACSSRNSSKLQRACQLRRFAQEQADLVVLHHSSHDVVPCVAFAIRDLPPVAVLNHADHIFWLGSTIADVNINLREIGRDLSRTRRATARDTVLPIPLAPMEHPPSRQVARERFGISADALVYLTVGRSLKYKPTSDGNFFATAKRILDCTSRAQLLVLGLDSANVESSICEDARFVFVGERPNSLDVRAAADVYLEGFPFGSQTAALEAARRGLPIVLAFAPPTPHLATSVDCFQGIVQRSESEEGYVSRAVFLGRELGRGIEDGKRVSQCVHEHHIGEGWRRHLSKLYAETDGLVHRPHPIPICDKQESPEDVALANWQFESSGLKGTLSDFLHFAAYDLRNRGYYQAAFSVLRSNLKVFGNAGQTMLAMAKLGPHWLYKKLNSAAPTSPTVSTRTS